MLSRTHALLHLACSTLCDISAACHSPLAHPSHHTHTVDYTNYTFFPLTGDPRGFQDTILNSGWATNEYGSQWPQWYRNQNFLFTTEIQLNFTYQGGEVFTFSGDDDVWGFMETSSGDSVLALDLGELRSV